MTISVEIDPPIALPEELTLEQCRGKYVAIKDIGDNSCYLIIQVQEKKYAAVSLSNGRLWRWCGEEGDTKLSEYFEGEAFHVLPSGTRVTINL